MKIRELQANEKLFKDEIEDRLSEKFYEICMHAYEKHPHVEEHMKINIVLDIVAEMFSRSISSTAMCMKKENKSEAKKDILDQFYKMILEEIENE